MYPLNIKLFLFSYLASMYLNKKSPFSIAAEWAFFKILILNC